MRIGPEDGERGIESSSSTSQDSSFVSAKVVKVGCGERGERGEFMVHITAGRPDLVGVVEPMGVSTKSSTSEEASEMGKLRGLISGKVVLAVAVAVGDDDEDVSVVEAGVVEGAVAEADAVDGVQLGVTKCF